MENTKNIAILFVLIIIGIPLVLSVRKVASYDTSKNFTVKFDPVTCYKCRDCPCTFVTNNGHKYILNKIDKNRCTHDPEIINKGIKENLNEVEFVFNAKTYAKFYDCISWYSYHPTTYQPLIN